MRCPWPLAHFYLGVFGLLALALLGSNLPPRFLPGQFEIEQNDRRGPSKSLGEKFAKSTQGQQTASRKPAAEESQRRAAQQNFRRAIHHIPLLSFCSISHCPGKNRGARFEPEISSKASQSQSKAKPSQSQDKAKTKQSKAKARPKAKAKQGKAKAKASKASKPKSQGPRPKPR